MEKLRINPKINVSVGTLIIVFIVSIALVALASSTTTFTKTAGSYYGRKSVVDKVAVVVTPTAADPNSINSTATSTDLYYCKLERISIAADGCDLDFDVILKDETGLAIFSKTDCNTALLPLSYALVQSDVSSAEYLGIPVAGVLTVDTNDVDPNNLTSVTITVYYEDFRYAGN
ncbi:MAG: hypothetical protein MUP16_04945 [Sedimentisphaerales bacterium]|nr:hypothetical protein [Sedimentisphaerales bacterium]